MGALPKGFRILGKVLSVDVNSPGALGFISKHWQGIFIQLLTALDRATGRRRRRRRRRQRHFWLHRRERWRWGSRPETNAGKSLFRIQLNASGSIHNTLRRLVIATECSIPTRPQTSELSVHFEEGSRNGAVYHREPLQLTHAGHLIIATCPDGIHRLFTAYNVNRCIVSTRCRSKHVPNTGF